jgi:hypothetical protein
MNVNKPNLFIIGAAKAGTTSLHSYLNEHPDIYMSPLKEPNFFGKDVDWNCFREDYKKNTAINFEEYFNKPILEEKHIGFVSSMDYYLQLFKNAPNQSKYLGEASTSYLYSLSAAQEIYNFNPQAKIIIILRDPIDRVKSHFLMDVARGKQRKSNCLIALRNDYESDYKGWGVSNLYIELSLYFDQIKRYLDLFPNENILFISFEKFKKNRYHVLEEIQSFLGLNTPFNVDSKSVKNKTTVPKYKFVNHLKAIKFLIPKRLINHMKINSTLLFESSATIELGEEFEEFVFEKTNSDWKKTQLMLNELAELNEQ